MDTKRLVLSILLLAISVCADTIVLKGSKKERNNVIIREETYKHVVFSEKNAPTSRATIPTRDVVEIIYEEIPPYFTRAENLFQVGKYADAAKAYQSLVKQEGWTQQHCMFKIGECHYMQGDYKKAIKQYNSLLDEFRETVYLLETQFRLGDSYVASQNPDWGKSYSHYSKAAAVAGEIKDDRERLRAIYKMGWCREQEASLDKAIESYDQLVRSSNEYPGWQHTGKLRKAHCLLKQQKYEDAKKMLLALGREEADNKILGGIYAGLGHYYLDAKRDKERALMCYLRVILMYPDEDEYAATAYQKAASCLDDLQEQLLFDIEANEKYQSTLNNEEVPKGLRKEFENRGYSLENISVKVKKENEKWFFHDKRNEPRYSVAQDGNRLQISRHNPQYQAQARQMRGVLKQKYPEWK